MGVGDDEARVLDVRLLSVLDHHWPLRVDHDGPAARIRGSQGRVFDAVHVMPVFDSINALARKQRLEVHVLPALTIGVSRSVDAGCAVHDSGYVGASCRPRMPSRHQAGYERANVKPPPAHRSHSAIGLPAVVEVEAVDVRANAHGQILLRSPRPVFRQTLLGPFVRVPPSTSSHTRQVACCPLRRPLPVFIASRRHAKPSQRRLCRHFVEWAGQDSNLRPWD